MTERVEITAKTFDEAIEIALERFQTTRDHLIVRTIDEGSKGIFGLGAKDAKIVVSLKTEAQLAQDAAVAKPAEVPAPKTEKPQKPAKTERPARQESVHVPVSEIKDVAQVQQRAAAFVTELIAKMQLDCAVDSQLEQDFVKIVITGEDVGTVIGRRGETLDSIQYLTNLHVNKGRHGDDYVRITLDTDSYRAKREETLIRLAKSMAAKVTKSRRDMALEPMNPYERRIIHSALQEFPNIKTRSVGEEPHRKIVISYKRP